MTTLYIVGLILSILAGVDQVIGTSMAKNKKLAITQDAQNILQQYINEKGDLEALLNAAQTKDIKLGRQILYSSPVGTRFKKLEREYHSNLDKMKGYTDDIAHKARIINDKAQETENKVNAVPDTGSAVFNLIEGATRGHNELKGKNPIIRSGSLQSIYNGNIT